MWFLSSEAKGEGTGVGNIIHINHDKTTPVSQKKYFQGPSVKEGVSSVVILNVCFQGQQHCHLLQPTHLCDRPCRWQSCWLPVSEDPCLAVSSHTLYTHSETPQHSSPGVFPKVQWRQSWSTKPENLGSSSPLGWVKKGAGCVIRVSQGHISDLLPNISRIMGKCVSLFGQ